jgi:S1-C subfamily serine protease
MDARDLPALRKLVADSRPIAPSQAAVLREIVSHVFLSAQQYEAGTTKGFLGVKLGTVSLSGASQADPALAAAPPDLIGIVIVQRFPGFGGARALQDGDVILGVAEQPAVQFHEPDDFRLIVASANAGDRLHFQVLRQGRVIVVPVVLSALPSEAITGAIGDRFFEDRDRAADEYWEKEFAPLLGEAIG